MKFIIAITNRDEKELAVILKQLTQEFAFNPQELLHTPDSLAMLKVSHWAKYRTKTLCFEDMTAATGEEIETYVKEIADHRCDVAVLALSPNNLSREALAHAAEEHEYLVIEGSPLVHNNPSKIFNEITILKDEFSAELRKIFVTALRKFIYQLATNYCNKDAADIVKVIKNPMLAWGGGRNQLKYNYLHQRRRKNIKLIRLRLNSPQDNK